MVGKTGFSFCNRAKTQRNIGNPSRTFKDIESQNGVRKKSLV